MSDLPRPNQSRTESYLGAIIEQEGAVKPERPESRIEQYLEYIIEQGVPSGKAGSKVLLTVDPTSYLMTLKLFNKDDEVISTTSVDLPLEEMIIGGRYDTATKTLILTLKNGEVLNIPIGDIISGLVEEAPNNNKYYARINGNWAEIIPFTQEEKTKLEGIEEGAEVNDPNTVVDANYVHTDNNYTNSEKTKLEGIEEGAEANDPNTVIDANYIHTDNNYTDLEKTKLEGIEEGAEANDPNTVVDANYVHTDNNYTTAEKQKLAGLENYDDTNVVKYTVQSKTDSEKAQARDNIKAASYDDLIRNLLINGVTKQQYNKLMKEWFIANGCAVMTDLTSLVERWYTLTRIGWNGGTKFNLPSKSSVSTGIAIGDNVGLNCTPSTNSAANTDDYASLPLFAIKDANVTLDTDGEPHVTAIEGIPGANAFDRYDTSKVVEVLQMTPWMKYSEDENYYTWEYTDEIGKTGYIPWPSAVSLKDNHVRAFVHHVKYVFGDGYTACSGRKVRVWDVSHNGQLTGVRSAWNNRYGGKSCSDDAWVKHMTYIKYKSLTLDGIMNGCLSYYYNTTKPAVAEENVERVIIAKSTASAWLVGSTICIGSAAYTSKSSQCSVVDRAKIVSIEDITIEGTVYSAVNLDNGGVKFNTTTDLFVTTMQWYTGSTDDVLGNDGSPYSNTSTKEPYKIQGIEQIVGCYEVMGDTILSYIDGYQVLHVCRDATKLATSITADYRRCSFGFPQPASSGWQYSKRLGFDPDLPELLYPSESGGSSSTFTKDGYYIDGTGSYTTGLREWPAFGDLNHGLGAGGLSCLSGDLGLAHSPWDFGGRLSSNINRGEFERSAA